MFPCGLFKLLSCYLSFFFPLSLCHSSLYSSSHFPNKLSVKFFREEDYGFLKFI